MSRSRRLPATLLAAIVLLAITTGLALVSLFWLPYGLEDTTGGRLEPPSVHHVLGTDKLGRDVASYVMMGSRIALTVGLGSAAIALVVGTAIGLAIAWTPALVDDSLASVLDVLIAFPTLLLAMVIGALRGQSLLTCVIAIGLATSALTARLARILARELRGQRFVVAATTSGTSRWGITRKHLLRNMWPTLAVNIAHIFGISVMAEAALSYLGLGVPPPNASLGRLLQEAQATVLTAPVGAIAPGVLIITLVIGANFLADGMRERVDPLRKAQR